MKLTITAAIVAVSIMFAVPATAHEAPRGVCNEPRYVITRKMDPALRADKAQALIRCVFGYIAPQEVQTALVIADRESSWQAFAWNRATDCRGLFQHLQTYWPTRVENMLRREWFPNTWPNVSAFNARANVIVAAKMVRSSGWGPWSTY